MHGSALFCCTAACAMVPTYAAQLACYCKLVSSLQIIMEHRQSAPEHKDWAAALKAFMARLQALAAGQFPQGLTWLGAAAPGAATPSPPAQAAATASSDASAASIAPGIGLNACCRAEIDMHIQRLLVSNSILWCIARRGVLQVPCVKEHSPPVDSRAESHPINPVSMWRMRKPRCPVRVRCF